MLELPHLHTTSAPQIGTTGEGMTTTPKSSSAFASPAISSYRRSNSGRDNRSPARKIGAEALVIG
ncbi:MAG: hypothetical protein JNK49_05540 [Planctomycetes bacterium]|nr:hypothetical protein [Planctomycetota bacterium]